MELTDSYRQHVLYTYAIGHMPQKDKVLFFYAIKGRNGKPGILEKLKIQQLGRCVLLAPQQAEAEFDQFLKKWNCAFTKRQVLVNYHNEGKDRPNYNTERKISSNLSNDVNDSGSDA